jgi:YesN/AraC family two-component response regulator
MADSKEINFVPDISYAIDRKCIADWNISLQEVLANVLLYVVKGNIRYIVNGIQYDLVPGDLLYMPYGSKQQVSTIPNNLMHCLTVVFQLKKVKNELDRLPFPIVAHIGIKADIVHLFNMLIVTWQRKQFGYKMETRGLLFLIVKRFYELVKHNADSEEDIRIKQVKEYINRHCASKITVAQMAELAGLNSAYFGLLFKKETGLSMHQYLMQIRIQYAESMLSTGQHKVVEVAHACGFSDEIHFYRNFKLIWGFPPSACIPRKSREEKQ